MHGEMKLKAILIYFNLYMNKYLKSALERYKSKEEFKIHPISKVDAEIVWELMIALGKLGINDLKDILDNYKYWKDSEVRDLLLQWNIDHPEGLMEEETTEESKKKKIRKFMKFDENLADVWIIKTVDIQDRYNHVKNEMEYNIILNKDFAEGFPTKKYTYKTPEVRKEKLDILESILSDDVEIIGK